MTFQKIKEDLVEEKQWVTEKKLTRFALNLGLAMLTIGVALSLITLSIMGLPMTILTIVCMVCIYMFTFDCCVESEKTLNRAIKLAKFWWLGILLCVAVYTVLRMFQFM